MNLQLSDAERDYVLRLLEAALGDLRVEVRRTRTPDYHDRLKQEEKLLEELLGKVRAGEAAASP